MSCPTYPRLGLQLSSVLVLLLQFTFSAYSSDDHCNQSLAACLDSTKTLQVAENSIPSTTEEVKETCHRFNSGMACVNQYLDRCANLSVRAVIESEIMGAKRFYQHLCGSSKFQETYLYHSACIRNTHADWNDCIRRYRSIIQHEINATAAAQDNGAARPSATTKYLHYCCAHRAYEKCVLNSAKYKCSPESVLFVRDVLSMESHPSCLTWDHRSKTDVCNSSPVPVRALLSFHLYANSLVAILVAFIGHHRIALLFEPAL